MSDPISPPLITHDDVRLFLLDRYADDNFLLDATESDDASIAGALRLIVDKYNSTTPILETVDAVTFPYRYELTMGTAAVLLRMQAINMSRNRLDYQTKEGAAVQDRARIPEYLNMARELMAEFDTRIKSLKVAANLEGAYGIVGSQFGYCNGRN